jgi:hypothetical protein
MDIYFPIAELSLNVFLLLGMGIGVGFLSGMFGIGGGFLLTPLLILIGVPHTVAVSTHANQLIAASFSGALAQWRRKAVDLRMGTVMLVGGLIGSGLGVWIFKILSRIGQIELVISLSYVIVLGLIGLLMIVESVRAILRTRRKAPPKPRAGRHPYWVRVLPFKMRFYRSRIYISALVPMAIGAFVGILVAIMGVGGGFVMVPAMIYLLGMPTAVVPGTSLFQIIFVAAAVTVLQAVENQTVDALLALILLVGGVIGAQFGSRFGARLRGEQLRALLAFIVLAVAVKLCTDLTIRPDSLFALEPTAP